MNADDLNRAAGIFDEVADLPDAERSRRLDALCAARPGVRALVDAMLESDRLGLGGDLLAAPSADPSQIGPYRIGPLIGEGGFGSVYEAEQVEPFRRRVALKIIKAGMDTRRVIARFEAERQALALMDHPNIATVLDAGTTAAGRPYFVMELVEGEPITAYCDRERLTIPQRLELLIQVCRAVQHAHTKGVIHRDLKPGNILVATRDGRPHVKVLDFGIAKAIDRPLTEKTLFTDAQQFIGTPEYMSPEQAAGSRDIDTRTDIYALGVLLYELLTGSTPFDGERLRSAAYAEVQRIIREEEPERPSLRAAGTRTRAFWRSTGDTAAPARPGAAPAEIAARRGADQAALTRRLRGDLDWITMKCLEKDRGRRYETANALAAELRRHLNDEPVTAGPPGRAYRARKFVRRHRFGTALAAVFLASLSIGLAGTTWGVFWALAERAHSAEEARRAEQEAERAEREAGRATAVLDVITEVLNPVRTRDEEGRPLSSVDLLRDFARSVGPRVEHQPEVEAEVRARLAYAMGMRWDYQGALEQAQRVLALRREAYGELHPLTTAAAADAVSMTSSGGDTPGALALAQDALDRAMRETSGDPLASPEIAHYMRSVAWGYQGIGDFARAEAITRQSLDLQRRRGDPKDARFSECVELLGWILMQRKHFDRAQPVYLEAAAVREGLHGALHVKTRENYHFASWCRREMGDFTGAAELVREGLERARAAAARGPSTPAHRAAVGDWLWLYAQRLAALPGREGDALAATREALDIARAAPLSGLLGPALEQLGHLFWALGRFDESEHHLREAMRVLRTHENWHWAQWRSRACGVLSDVLRDRGGDPAEAEELAREALNLTFDRTVRQAGTPWSWRLQISLCRRLQGDHDEADRLEREVLGSSPAADAIYVSALEAHRMNALGEWLMKLDRPAAAEPPFAACVWALERLCPDHWLRFDAMSALGGCLASQGRFPEAEPLLLGAWAGFERAEGTPDDPLRRLTERVLRLYAAWDAAEPGGRPATELATWRARLGAAGPAPPT